MDYNELPSLLTTIKRIITPKQIIVPGLVKLTSAGTATFTGTDKKSVTMTVISRTSGTVSIVADGVTTDASYAGYTTTWTTNKLSDLKLGSLTITVTGDAIVMVSYTL